MRPLELYIHIPFCVKKCRYCDFLSAPATPEARQEYVMGLCQKIRSYYDLAGMYHVSSIFIGGGTPSILETQQMRSIFDAIRATFPIDSDAEITVEVNPGTVDKLKLMAYRNVGINRLSIGLQSTDDQELKMLGRIHTYKDFLDTYTLAREVGCRSDVGNSISDIGRMGRYIKKSGRTWSGTYLRIQSDHRRRNAVL